MEDKRKKTEDGVLNGVMESETIQKNERKLKNRKRINIKTVLMAILVFAISICSYGQELRPVQLSNNKWGFINEAGKVVIPFKYKAVGEFSEGLALVFRKINKKRDYIFEKQGRWGYIDKTGKEVIPLIYDAAGDFSEGLARVMIINENGRERWGFIDKTGKEIIPFIYNDAGDFYEGLARVNFKGKWGFIDKTGKEVFKNIATEIKIVSETVVNQTSTHPTNAANSTQTASEPSRQFKSTAGNCGVEAQFMPFSTEVGVIQTVTFEVVSDLDLKTAYGVSAWFFVGNKVELKTSLLFGTTSFKDKIKSENEKIDEIHKESYTTYGLALGLNFHFKGTARISPYMGLNMFLGTANYKEKTDNWNFKSSDSQTIKVGMMMAGFSLATGFNWYIVDGLYIGAEIGLGAGFGKGLKSKTQMVIDGEKTTTEVKPTASGINIDFIANPAIRLGWRF